MPSSNSHRRDHEALGCPVRFGQSWYGFEYSGRGGHCANPPGSTRKRDASLPNTLKPRIFRCTAPLSERVAERVRQLLPTGHCGVDTIADQLAIHLRTLQRHLAAEAMCCQEIIDPNDVPKQSDTWPCPSCNSARLRACSATPNKARSTGPADAGLERRRGSSGSPGRSRSPSTSVKSSGRAIAVAMFHGCGGIAC